MKISDKRSTDECAFCTLAKGTVFEYSKRWYMKINPIVGSGHPNYNAVWLDGMEAGTVCGFSSDIIVKAPGLATLTVE
jgi:hypothetical protein